MPSPLPGFDDAVEFAIEPIYGLRVFFGGPHGLYSVHQSEYMWSAGLNKNFCFSVVSVGVRETTGPPLYLPYWSDAKNELVGWNEHDMFPCSCGFYGYHTRAHLEEQYRNILDLNTAVVGVIKATGKMVLGEKGFRAERAEIVALAPARGIRLTGGETLAELQARLYGVPFYPNPRSLLGDYPTTFGDGSLTNEEPGHTVGLIKPTE